MNTRSSSQEVAMNPDGFEGMQGRDFNYFLKSETPEKGNLNEKEKMVTLTMLFNLQVSIVNYLPVTRDGELTSFGIRSSVISWR